MKFVILCLSLAVLATTVCDSASLQKSNRANLSTGWIRPGDGLLRIANVTQSAVPNTIQYQDYVYRGNYNTYISAVVANENGGSQHASAQIISGGIGFNNITIRLQSARGLGFNYSIYIFGL